MRKLWLTVGLTVILISGVLPTAAQDDYTCVNTYTVQSGDNLYRIAQANHVDWGELAALNGIENPRVIFAGDVLCLDGLAEALPAPADGTGGPTPDDQTPPPQPVPAEPIPAEPIPAQPAPQQPVAPPPGFQAAANVSVTSDGLTYSTDNLGYYTVQPHDNLYRVSLAFGVAQDVLVALNGIENPSIIFVGQRLLIPLPTPSGPVPGSYPAISIVPRLAAPGDEVTVIGNNYPPNADVEIFLEKPSLQRQSDALLTVTTDANGNFSAALTIPAQWSDGSAVNTRTVSFSGRMVDDSRYWGMNFFINAAWTP
ncbi:MAG: LysM peptidoglycan-binding domain-containing protein [Anaerolineales bacterium]|nr:LysM peptidoglycan-binding domain-containing protein [Anaerolineales bacterium]